MAGIKFHAAIESGSPTTTSTAPACGLWLDWMAQGTRVSRNLFHDNASNDLFVEVDHGPFLVDNNLFLSAGNLLDMSEGGAYVHNLFAGKITNRPEPGRETPFHPAHPPRSPACVTINGGDDRYYNNIFVGNGPAPVPATPAKNDAHRAVPGYGLWVYNVREFPLQAGGNVYLGTARPYVKETGSPVLPDWNADVVLVEAGGHMQLQLSLPESFRSAATRTVTTALLGEARIPQLPFVSPDDAPLTVDADYFGQPRPKAQPTPGPFENAGPGRLTLQVR